MELSFLVHKQYLTYHLLLSGMHLDERITALQDNAWEYSSSLYNIAIGRPHPADLNDINTFSAIGKFFEHIQQTSQFKEMLRETEDHKEACEAEWDSVKGKAESLVKDLTGFNFQKQFNVYIVHPALNEGRYLGNREIVWGHHKEWPYYAVVYMWHEILHEYLGYEDTDHALIQLITDNELRVQLGEGTYPPFKGHSNLFPLMEEMLPLWREYLSTESSKRDLEKLRNQIKRRK